MITFRYQELSDGGVPRFPSFVRVHEAAGTSSKKSPASKRTTKKSAKAKAPKKSKEPARDVRYFELDDEKSSKFWEVVISGNEATRPE